MPSTYYDYPTTGFSTPPAAGYTSAAFPEWGVGMPDDTWRTVTGTILSGESKDVAQVLGKVTATGKYRLSLAAATDGSQVPAGILIGVGGIVNLAPGAAAPPVRDEDCTVLISGRVFAENLIFGAGHSLATVRAVMEDMGFAFMRRKGL